MNEFLAVILSMFGSAAKATFVFLAAVILAYWVGAPIVLQTLIIGSVVLFVLDTISGAWLAAYDKRFSSRTFGKAITKFSGFAFAICISIPMGYVLAAFWPGITCYILLTCVMMMIFTKEATSCLEMAKTLGFPLPKWVSDKLREIDRMAHDDPTKKTVTKTETCEIETDGETTTEVCESVEEETKL